MAVDRYSRVAANSAPIVATPQPMRAIKRRGGAAVLDRAFTPKQPWEILGLVTSSPTRQDVEDAYRRLAMKNHPDRGGDPEEMAKINAARAALLEDL